MFKSEDGDSDLDDSDSGDKNNDELPGLQIETNPTYTSVSRAANVTLSRSTTVLQSRELNSKSPVTNANLSLQYGCGEGVWFGTDSENY